MNYPQSRSEGKRAQFIGQWQKKSPGKAAKSLFDVFEQIMSNHGIIIQFGNGMQLIKKSIKVILPKYQECSELESV